jgi:hypothetical protein
LPAERETADTRRRGADHALVPLICLVLSGPALANPAFDYLLHCGGCHREDGAGAPPAVPDLRESVRTFARTPDGRAYMVRVPGASQAPIDDAGLAGVLNWMLVNIAGDRGARPFTPGEVSRYRSEPLLDPLTARRAVLAADGAHSEH